MTLPLAGILLLNWPHYPDYLFYSTILEQFSHQFWRGELYPRWLLEANAGFGSPVFLFYGPLAFYIATIFEPLAGLDPHGFWRQLLTMGAAVFAAGWSAHYWLSQWFGENDARKGGLLYACLPYMFVPFYLCYGVAQLWGIALLPLLLAAAHLIAQGQLRKGIALLSAGYALLALSHMPSFVVFSAVPWLYAIYFSPRGLRVRGAVAAGAAGLLGLGLAGIYLIPSIANRLAMNLGHYAEPAFSYAHNFNHFYGIIGAALLVLPLVVLFFGLPKGRRRDYITTPVRFWLAIALLWGFMASPLSRPVWEVLTPLHYLSFPFRFLVALMPACVFLNMLWDRDSKQKNLLILLAAAVLMVGSAQGMKLYFLPTKEPVAEQLAQKTIPFSEYRTKAMVDGGIDAVSMPTSLLEMPAVEFVQGAGSATLNTNESRRITLSADITEPAKLVLRRFYFDGWQSDNATVSNEGGLIALATLPPGHHEISLTLPHYPGEKAGRAASLIALLLWLALIFNGKIRRK